MKPLVESVEWAVLKEGLPVAGVECADWKDMFEPGDGEGRRGVRFCVGNWDPVVKRGERSWGVEEAAALFIRGEL